MNFSRFIAQEWKPALGCTEPASIAYAASLAASLVAGEIKSVSLRCDPRIYKNCYAVGIPNSEGKIGILWALAIGTLLPNPSLELECFKQANPEILSVAGALLQKSGAISVDADPKKEVLYIDCQVYKTGGVGRVVIENTHTGIVAMEKDGISMLKAEGGARPANSMPRFQDFIHLTLPRMIQCAQSATTEDRRRLCKGIDWNLAIAELGTGQFGNQILDGDRNDLLALISQKVFGGVYARMSGANQVVMSAAGSGNKGITCSVPLALYGKARHLESAKVEEALAIALMLNSITTHYLGTLSAICGCSNAAGIGLAGGLVYLQGGGATEISHAISNMVGNISGIICDGAKIGCALKAMTAVDSAFRASALAMRGIYIPVSDGIVGADGMLSLQNLGRIATRGMDKVDNEILDIMKEKLEARA